MPLSFPSNPAVNQTSTQNGRVYRWSGSAWEFAAASGTGGTVTIPEIGDQYWLATQLLLRGDGSLSDSSNYDRSVTNYGAAATGTAKYGSNSLLFSGSSAYLRVAGSSAFSLPGDFTLEAWVYFSAASSSYSGAYGACIMATYPAGSGGWQLRINGNATSYTTINLYTGVTDLNWNGTFAINQWHHVAVCRSGSSIRAFINGVQVGSTQTCTDNMDSYSGDVWIGRLNASPYFFQMNGLMDDLRITKAARYVANFTPPTAALPLGFHTPAQTLTISGSGGGSGLTWSSAPASATATGTAGQIAYDGSYLYLATATDTWKRAALTTWTNFTPASVSGLQLWLDASASDTLYDATSGGSLVAADGAVARWEDKSSNGRHFTQSSSGSRPLRKTSQQNGKDTLLFDGTNDVLLGPDFGDYLQSGQAATVFMVMKASSTGRRHELINKQNVLAGWRFLIESDNKATLFCDSDASNRTTVAASTATTVSGYTLLAWRASGGSLTSSASMFRNGASISTATTGSVASVPDTSEVMAIGAAYANNTIFDSLNGNIGEVIIYNAALSDTDRAAVESYLMTKWGIS